MTRRILWMTFAAAIVFGGCSGQTPPPPEKKAEAPAPQPQALVQTPETVAAGRPKRKPTKHCNTKSGKCELVITVTACTADGITIDHEVLGVEPGTRDLNIDWVIATAGYDFNKTDGIKFKGDDWKKEFDQPTGNKNKFRWRDRNNSGGPLEREYEYSITVTKDDGSPCATKDPTVVNDG